MRKMIRAALTKDQARAVQTIQGATVLVTEMNRNTQRLEMENEAHKLTIQQTQDQLESWKDRYHETDKEKGILSSQIKYFIGIEIIKFLITSVLIAFGVNQLPSAAGILLVFFGTLGYILLTTWQNSNTAKK